MRSFFCVTDSGERPYKCDHCDKSFARFQTLEEHRNRHLGIKPYSCSHCSKCKIAYLAMMKMHYFSLLAAFPEMSQYYKHLKTAHDETKVKDEPAAAQIVIVQQGEVTQGKLGWWRGWSSYFHELNVPWIMKLNVLELLVTGQDTVGQRQKIHQKAKIGSAKIIKTFLGNPKFV